jgi:hypothetical protein
LTFQKKVLLFLFFCTSFSGLAQIEATILPISYRPDSLLWLQGSNSRVGINTFSFLNRLQTKSKYKSHYAQAKIMQHSVYNQNLMPAQRFVTRDWQTEAQYEYKFKKDYQIGQLFSLQDFAANQTRISRYQVYAAKQYKINARHLVKSIVFAGVLSDKRIENSNSGLTYGMWSNYFYTDSTTNSRLGAFYQDAFILPRRNNYLRIDGVLDKKLNEFVQVNVAAIYTQRRVEDYITNNIQQIRSDTAQIGLGLQYRILPKLYFFSDNLFIVPARFFNYRLIPNQNTGLRQNIFFNEQNVNTTQRLNWSGKKLNVSALWQFKYRNRSYGVNNNLGLSKLQTERLSSQERIKDISEAYTTWQYELRYQPKRKHIIEAATFAQLLRVNTPSERNNQDRDEVLYTGSVAYTKRWNTIFSTTFRVAGNWKHFVYIKAAQSNENFKERSIRFEPSYKWKLPRFSWEGEYGLWATYQVRDAENQQDKNRANRILNTRQEINWDFAKKQTLQLIFIRRENRVGVLNWQKFSEAPLDTTTVYDVLLEWKNNMAHNATLWQLRLGYRFFSQTQRSLAGLRSDNGNQTIAIRTYVLQHGPQTGIMLQQKNLAISADCWMQVFQSFRKYDAVSNTVFAGINYTTSELQSSLERLYPFFNINFSWLLRQRIK